jgi:hypothetical protein
MVKNYAEYDSGKGDVVNGILARAKEWNDFIKIHKT